jgi:hypothetical protein
MKYLHRPSGGIDRRTFLKMAVGSGFALAAFPAVAVISRPSDRVRIFFTPFVRSPVTSRANTNFAPKTHACW